MIALLLSDSLRSAHLMPSRSDSFFLASLSTSLLEPKSIVKAMGPIEVSNVKIEQKNLPCKKGIILLEVIAGGREAKILSHEPLGTPPKPAAFQLKLFHTTTKKSPGMGDITPDLEGLSVLFEVGVSGGVLVVVPL